MTLPTNGRDDKPVKIDPKLLENLADATDRYLEEADRLYRGSTAIYDQT
jgi:hypothetical protein